jgi:DNA polymerase I
VTTDVLLIDGQNLIHRCYHALAVRDPDVSPAAVLATVASSIAGCRAELGRPRYGAVALDDGTGDRTTLLPGYKASRRPKPPALARVLAEAGAREQLGGLRVVRAPGHEADDALAVLAHGAAEAGLSSAVVSADSDLLQLVGPTCVVLRPVPQAPNRGTGLIVFDRAVVRRVLGVEPHQIPAYKALVGDAGDDVPGVPGIGPVRAAQLLCEHGSLERALDALRVPPVRRGEDLGRLRQRARIAFRVCLLRVDVPVSLPLEACRC